MLLALAIMATVLPPAELPSGGIVATVSGGARPWVLAIPLDSQLAARTYAAREPVTISGVGTPALVCAGADDRATLCERIAAGDNPQRRYALDEGRQVTGRWFIGRRPIAGAALRVRLAGGEARRPLMIPLARRAKDLVTAVSTDETGRYAIDHLAPGNYIFELTTRSGRIEESGVEIPPLKVAVPDRPLPSRAYAVPD